VEIKHDGTEFFAVATYEERLPLKEAGFWWDKEKRRWWTKKTEIAVKLEQWMDESARERVLAFKAEIEKSKAADADIEIPVPVGLEYMPFQKAGVAYALARPGTLFGDEMGLGKTIQAIGVINAEAGEKTNYSVLVVCPASLKYNWRNELRKWLVRERSIGIADAGTWPDTDIVIINYDVLGRHDAVHGRFWDCLILDECHYCFDYESKVLTNKGEIEIGKIVEDGLDVSVLSCSLYNNALSYKKIKSRFMRFCKERLVRIKFKGGYLDCTQNHKIWVEGFGYKEAGTFIGGEELRMVRERVYGEKERKGYAKILFLSLFFKIKNVLSGFSEKNIIGANEVKVENEMSVVQENHFQTLIRHQKILRAFLCRKMEDVFFGKKGAVEEGGENSAHKKQGQKTTRPIPENENKKPDADKKECRKNEKESIGKKICFKGREWFHIETAEKISRLFGLAHRVCGKNRVSEKGISQNTEQLQGGYCKPGEKNSHRDRWEGARWEEENIRQKKGGCFKIVRVESVKILEPRNTNADGFGSSKGQYVYNVEVEDNNNYFANGILVSNCKSRKAKRTKLALSIQARTRLLLTGTPILNRPIELYTLLQFLDKERWSNWWKYANRYCGALKNRWGLDVSGASNLDELQETLRATVMVRRLKKDVLKELPPKRRQVIEIQAEECAGAVRDENEAWESQQGRLTELREAVELAKTENEDEYAAAVNRLREAAGVAFAEISRLRHETALAKVPYVIDHVEAVLETGQKVVVMAHHLDVIAAIVNHFGNKAVKLTGDDSKEARQEAVDAFQNRDDIRVFVGSIKAAGVGLTLTAASTMVFAELDWVPGNVSQAEDRIHRIGQSESVLIQHIVLDESLDASMAKTLVAKQEVLDRALDVVVRAMPVFPGAEKGATSDTGYDALTVLAERVRGHKDMILVNLKAVSAMCDGANAVDGMGFNKMDTGIGKSLARQSQLSDRQAALAYKLVWKYRGQIGQEVPKL